MKQLRLGDRVLVLISESNSYNWAVHEADQKFDFRKPFITYIGGTKEELEKIKKSLNAVKIELRKAKRLPYPCELKIWGLQWDEARLLSATYEKRLKLLEDFNPSWVCSLLLDHPYDSLQDLINELWDWRYKSEQMMA